MTAFGIVVAIGLSYILIAVITGKMIRNHHLTQSYNKMLIEVTKARKTANWKYGHGETVEERALQLAKDQIDYDGTVVFWAGLGGYLWPMTLVGYLCKKLIDVFAWMFKGLNVIESKAERQVKSVVAERERKTLLDQQEIALKAERKKLIKLAKELDIRTKELEDL